MQMEPCIFHELASVRLAEGNELGGAQAACAPSLSSDGGHVTAAPRLQNVAPGGGLHVDLVLEVRGFAHLGGCLHAPWKPTWLRSQSSPAGCDFGTTAQPLRAPTP